MNERHFRRVPFEADVLVSTGGQSWSCRLLDLALKGALLESGEVPLEKGAIARLAMTLPGTTITLAFEAELAHREGNHLGFKFLREDLQTLTHLRKLLELNTGDPEGVRGELPAWLKG